jgi:hypothetical protein
MLLALHGLNFKSKSRAQNTSFSNMKDYFSKLIEFIKSNKRSPGSAKKEIPIRAQQLANNFPGAVTGYTSP